MVYLCDINKVHSELPFLKLMSVALSFNILFLVLHVIEDDIYYDEDDDEVCDANINLQQTANGWCVVMNHVPSALIGYVVGQCIDWICGGWMYV